MAEVEGWPQQKLGINDFSYIKGRLEAQGDLSLLFGMFFAFQVPLAAVSNAFHLAAPFIGFSIGTPIAYGLLRSAIKKIDNELHNIAPQETKKFLAGLFRCTAASRYYGASCERLVSETEQFLNNVSNNKFSSGANSVYGRTFWTRACFLQANVSAHGDGSRLDMLCLDGWPRGNYADGLLAKLAQA
ncbi:MAG: hypothetical protein HYT16_01365 [DPANN group archaeon]|nr:hypothetical protein [DPANN group archaeon]